MIRVHVDDKYIGYYMDHTQYLYDENDKKKSLPDGDITYEYQGEYIKHAEIKSYKSLICEIKGHTLIQKIKNGSDISEFITESCTLSYKGRTIWKVRGDRIFIVKDYINPLTVLPGIFLGGPYWDCHWEMYKEYRKDYIRFDSNNE